MIRLRIIVFSDSHGSKSAVHKVYERNEDADLFIFLGDGEREFDYVSELYSDKKSLAVCGNCDMCSMKKGVDITTAGGKKIVFLHGNAHDVKHTKETVKKLARDIGADIVLFGHTHQRYYEYCGGLFILNPGSISRPRDGKLPSYAFIDITNAGVVCNHVDL